MPSHYEILGVSASAPPEAIRRAYRERAKTAHPDAESGGTSAMVRLNQAYETLKDPARRAAYDASLRRGAGKPLPRRGSGRPAGARPAPGTDPLEFFVRVFQPLDAELKRAIATLYEALEELAYDLYDDDAINTFDQAVERSKRAYDMVSAQLHGNPWPDPWTNALNLYSQGLRQVEDALEDFATFSLNFDSDLLVEGRTILSAGTEILTEAAAGMRLG